MIESIFDYYKVYYFILTCRTGEWSLSSIWFLAGTGDVGTGTLNIDISNVK